VVVLALCFLAGQLAAAAPKICPMQFDVADQSSEMPMTDHSMHKMPASDENLDSDAENCCSKMDHCSVSGCSLIAAADTSKPFDLNQFSQVVDSFSQLLVKVTTDSLYRPPILS
jgi:uncharacterized protein involved in copper resistance